MIGPILTGGFASAVAMWILAFLSRLPGANLPVPATAAILLTAALVGCFATALAVQRRQSWIVGLGTGVVAGVLNLLILGSLLAQPAEAGSTLRPNAGLAMLGFLGMSTLIGLVGGVLALAAPVARTGHERGVWLGRFALVAVISLVPLLLVGGLVTSNEAGMSVPDWPTSYGANMFLLPLATMAQPRIFLEHTHRLFGSLAGLTVFMLTIYVFVADRRFAVRTLALALSLMILAQGILGGARVLEGTHVMDQDLLLALIHGVSAHLVLAGAVILAACVSPTFRHGPPATLDPSASRVRVLSITLMGCLFVQLMLGATFRHLGNHAALGLHVLMAIVVAVIASTVGFSLTSERPTDHADRTLYRVGRWLIGVVPIQIGLGIFAAWAVLAHNDHSTAPQASELIGAVPVPPIEAYSTSAHQAVGALLMALAALAVVWSHRLLTPPQRTA